MYCLDTNIIIDFLRGNEESINGVKTILMKGEIFITPISLCEIYKGIYLYDNIEEELRIFDEVLTWLNILDFNKEVCKAFGKEYARLKKIGKLTQEFDLMIASFVKVNNLILITRNKKHFENINIKIEVW